MATKPRTIDEYLASLSSDKRAALQKLRKAIKAAAPKAEECISYQIPAFRLDGKMLVWFGAATNQRRQSVRRGGSLRRCATTAIASDFPYTRERPLPLGGGGLRLLASLRA